MIDDAADFAVTEEASDGIVYDTLVTVSGGEGQSVRLCRAAR